MSWRLAIPTPNNWKTFNDVSDHRSTIAWGYEEVEETSWTIIKILQHLLERRNFAKAWLLLQEESRSELLTEPNILQKSSPQRKLINTPACNWSRSRIGCTDWTLSSCGSPSLGLWDWWSFDPVLEDTLSPYDNISVVQRHFKVDWKETEYFDQTLPIKVVANLPYYITTLPIIWVHLNQIWLLMRCTMVACSEKSLIESANREQRLANSPYRSLAQYYMEAVRPLLFQKQCSFHSRTWILRFYV